MFWFNKSSFKFNLNDNKYKIKITNPKIESQTDMYRLCSPNYNGIFELNAAKNGGVDYWQVSCTYKPYSPFILIQPNFGELYNGSDAQFVDNRGLILGGDYSLPIITDQFKQYEIQNKNYNQIFNREIQNMNVNHQISQASNLVNTITSTAVQSAMNPAFGAQAGIRGITNMATSQLQYEEALDYKRDMFGYQLDNIKALPQSLSKSSPLNINNKYWPFIEYYTCTDTEKTAFQNKIKYNGMRLMVVGTLNEYFLNLPNTTDRYYFKGQLIQNDTISDDWHIMNEISNELNKGFYVKSPILEVNNE